LGCGMVCKMEWIKCHKVVFVLVAKLSRSERHSEPFFERQRTSQDSGAPSDANRPDLPLCVKGETIIDQLGLGRLHLDY
jgi:hypothetical protein